jgi:hypothetical protein
LHIPYQSSPTRTPAQIQPFRTSAKLPYFYPELRLAQSLASVAIRQKIIGSSISCTGLFPWCSTLFFQFVPRK